jgi:hypothetical protein
MTYRQKNVTDSSSKALARGLGWFSIGLGLAEMLAPKLLTRQMGMEGKEALFRFYGAREMAAGIGILMSGNPGPWIWGRVAGDALDLATLTTGLGDDNPRKGNVTIILAAVAGVTALDAITAQALTSAAGDTGRPKHDYSDRRGMPRTPEALRAFTSQSATEHSRSEYSRA